MVKGFTPLEITPALARPKGLRGGLFLTGFTIAEILVVTALFAILLSLGAGIFLSNNQFYENQSGKITLLHSAREAADRLSEHARTAVAFVSSYTYNSVLYETDADMVILQLPALDASDNVITGSYDYVLIGADPGNLSRLILIIDPHPASSRVARNLLVSDHLLSLNYSYDNADLNLARIVGYQISFRSTGRFPVNEQVFGSATLRNK